MKNVKIVLSSLLVVAGLVTLSSFISKDFKGNAFAQVCHEYINSVKAPENGDPVRPEASYDISTTVGNPSAACPDSEVLCVICYDDAVYTSFEDVRGIFGNYLDELKSQFPEDLAWDHVPSGDPFTIPGTSIQIYKFAEQ